MEKIDDIKKIMEKIELDKEILSTMPQNNQKNRKTYNTELNNLKEKYETYLKLIESELKRRYELYVDIKPNEKIENFERQYREINKNLYLVNTIKTSYEKMELDKVIYKLDKYYKENLESVNQEILNAIRKFKEVGIELTEEDFNLSSYAREYMKVFLEEIKEDINSKKLRDAFEEIYWKCPELVAHIKLNLLNIFYTNEGVIDKYYIKAKGDFLGPLQLNEFQLQERYLKLKEKITELKRKNSYEILQSFLQGKENILDYTDEKLRNYYGKISTEETIDFKNISELDHDVFSFINSLNELKNYHEFVFIVEDIKRNYKEKTNYKILCNSTKKEIVKKEKQLAKLNKQMSTTGIFGNKKVDAKKALCSEIVKELEKLYKELDKNRIFYQINSNLSDSSTLYDVIYCASSFQNYLISYMIENNNEITMEEIESQIQKLNEFLTSPYNTIIRNITILEEKDVNMIVKDRYKLLKFNITLDDLNTDNIENLLSTLNLIEKGINIRTANLKVNEIENACQIKKLLQNN